MGREGGGGEPREAGSPRRDQRSRVRTVGKGKFVAAIDGVVKRTLPGVLRNDKHASVSMQRRSDENPPENTFSIGTDTRFYINEI